MKVALVYDRINKWGGAERVLLNLHEIFPDAPLYTSVYDKKMAAWADVFPEIKTSFLQKIPFAKNNHEFLAPLMPLAFESFDFSDFDVVISVTSEAAKGIITYGKTLHLCYCLTPTRYLWSHKKMYFKNNLLKEISKPVVGRLAEWDKKAGMRPDVFVGISTEVVRRIKRYYKRKALIIFPPVKPLSEVRNIKTKDPYYLLVSRLDFGYKKVELAIEAFNRSGKNLLIVGDGRQRNSLQKIAKSNIKFAGRVSDKKLTGYYKKAKALVMPQEEDFGIVSVEAQSVGVPVIAFGKGGALDTVVNGKTGIFFDKQTPEKLIEAVEKFEKLRFDKRNLIKNSARFSHNVFKRELLGLIKHYSII